MSKGPHLTQETMAQVRELARQGVNFSEIGRRLGISRDPISRRTQKLSIESPWKWRGQARAKPEEVDKPPRILITEDDREDIRRMVAEGKSGAEIARYIGCTRQPLNRLIKRMGLQRPQEPRP